MYLEEASQGTGTAVGIETPSPSTGGAECFAAWHDWEPARIAHHGSICCEIATEWLAATDRSYLGAANVLTGPRWLRSKFKWGAMDFPIHWCEVVKKETIDCGAHADMAFEVFRQRRVQVLRAQIVQRFSAVATAQWASKWTGGTCDRLPWTDGDHIYHEAVAVRTSPHKVKVWDPSAGWWVDPKGGSGYGSIRAIRFTRAQAAEPPLTLEWGGIKIKEGQWTELREGY